MNTMDMPLVFPFHYGQEADQYSFYKVPKVLFTSPVFEKLSTEAKLLYGLLLDRMQLSIRNGWVDEQGRVYIYFTVESIMRALNCGNKKAGGLLNELDDKKGIGLITRIRQGQGRPDKLLIHKCTVPEMSYAQVKTCQNDMSRDAFSTGQEMSKGHANNTKGIKTEENETHIYLSGEKRIRNDANVYEQYRTFFWEQLGIENLMIDYPYEEETLYEVLDLLVETVCSNREMIRVAGDDKPAEIVKSRLMKLNSEHIRYVMHCMNETTVKVRNIRQYLLATLYNAPATIKHYYSALVQHDMYGGGE